MVTKQDFFHSLKKVFPVPLVVILNDLKGRGSFLLKNLNNSNKKWPHTESQADKGACESGWFILMSLSLKKNPLKLFY